MERQEHTNIIQELKTMAAEDKQARVTELLTKLSDDYAEKLTEAEKAAESIKTLTEEKEHLRDVNSKLFLKVGQPTKEDEKTIPKEDEEPPSFDSLFNEKGELK